MAAEARAAADRPPPRTDDSVDLGRFYRDRARAAGQIGRASQRIADLRQAAAYLRGLEAGGRFQILSELFDAELNGGNFRNAVNLREKMAQGARKDWQELENYSELAIASTVLGDVRAAEEYLLNAEGLGSSALQPGGRRGRGRGLRSNVRYRQHQVASRLEAARASIAFVEGRFAEAEAAYRTAAAEAEEDVKSVAYRTTRSLEFAEDSEAIRDRYETLFAETLMRQSKFNEAEYLCRSILKRILLRTGHYSVYAAGIVRLLSIIKFEEGRYRDAAILARAAIDIFDKTGAAPESLLLNEARKNLGRTLVVERKWQEANGEFEKVEAAYARDSILLQKLGAGDLAWSIALTQLNQSDKAIAMLTSMLDRTRDRFGDKSFEVAEIRGFLGIAHGAAGQRDAALKEFGASVPLLLDQFNAQAGESGGGARTWRLTQILESYIGVLLDAQRNAQPSSDIDALAESFRLADVARGGRVQRALAQSAARATTASSELAELARKVQDAELHMSAREELLRSMLSAPPDQQITRVIEDLRKELVDLGAERKKTKAAIEKRFPEYANLIDPKPPTVAQVRMSLREGEALISIYVGRDRTFVWAIPKNGTPVVAAANIGDTGIAHRVATLRRALDMGASGSSEILKFDVALAHELFTELLQPVEAGWGAAKSLLIVPHLALGQLPFALLPTAMAALPAEKAVQFGGYQQVKWLVRRAAITQLPAAATLITLRQTPPSKTTRRAYAGFGDPFFTKKQAAEEVRDRAKTSVSTRPTTVGLRNSPRLEGVSSAELAQLPPLPDTRMEILEVAKIMSADVNQDVFLGKRASVKTVKGMPLNNRKVIHFATHGLVPGDLDGLRQPALALTSSDVADKDSGDGLLKLDDILELKLDADWVVLSACNTASGEGSDGAEAVSGLGRAFLFAGTRALLVSNWPVESVSARKLITDIFRRQATDVALERAEALRQAMLALIDDGEVDPATGAKLYRYAHPLFWAPFALIGEGSAH